MIHVHFAVMSERDRKPVIREVCKNRGDAEESLERLQRQDAAKPQDHYWIAELGPGVDAWLILADEP